MRRRDGTDDGTERQADEAAFDAALGRALKDDPTPVPGPELGWARLSRELDRAAPPALGRARAWRAAAAALALVALAQGAFILSRDGADLRLAGAEASLTVGFRPGTGEAEMRALLRDAGVQVTAGPSALGLWRLEGDDPTAARAALEASGLVETVSGP